MRTTITTGTTKLKKKKGESQRSDIIRKQRKE